MSFRGPVLGFFVLLLLLSLLSTDVVLCDEDIKLSAGIPSAGCQAVQPAANNSTKRYTLMNNGLSRSYYVHIPINYDHKAANGQPLVLALHGYSGEAYWMSQDFDMNNQSNVYNYVAVYPQGSYLAQNYSSWNDLSCSGSPGPDGPTCDVLTTEQYPVEPNCQDSDGNHCNWCTCNADDISFMNALLDALESAYCIDISREYALGFSNGATMTHRLGCALNNRLAAVAPFHGTMAIGFNCMPAYAQYPMPILLVWGTEDTTEPGMNIIAWNGFYVLSVSGVMNQFAMHNGCVVDKHGYANVKTSSDGIRQWKCMALNQQCNDNAQVWSCSWNGKHQYPMTQDGWNFGLDVVWQFFEQHTRVPVSV